MKYIIGNWKSNKDMRQTRDWFAGFYKLYTLQKDLLSSSDVKLVICPPFVLLSLAHGLVREFKLPVLLGAQNISPYEEGAFTGEVTAKMVAEIAGFVIIGHSERREKFGETDDMLFEKVDRARSAGLTTVYCVQGAETPVPGAADVVAYEPVWAIGTGKTESPQKAGEVASEIKNKNSGRPVIYGGSVKADNAGSFLQSKNIDGVLPGGASLDPESFWKIALSAVQNK